jgi:hypothetical protein
MQAKLEQQKRIQKEKEDAKATRIARENRCWKV